MPREMIISTQTKDDIRKLCLTYQYSDCFCDHMKRISKNTQHECYACIAKRVLAAIEPMKPESRNTKSERKNS